MTKRLYWDKPYQKEFSAIIMDVKRGALILDKTLFYATAGNQIHDTGTIIVNQETYQVVNVEKEDDMIFHYVLPKPTSHMKGLTVKGKIDWNRRYSIMKSHSAQHIISAIMLKQFNNKTTHANIKAGEFIIEFVDEVSKSQLQSVIHKANANFTFDNKKIHSFVLTPEKAREQFSTKIRGIIPDEEIIRILEVQDIDCNTCGGTHVKNTCEIGPIYISKINRNREVEFESGEKAIQLLTYSNINSVFIQRLLNCSLEEFPDIIEKKLQEMQDTNITVKDLSSLIMKLLLSSSYEEINGIKLRFLEVDIPKKILFGEFKKFGSDNILIVKSKPNQYLILSSASKFTAKHIAEQLKIQYGGKGGGGYSNAQILFEHEPNDFQQGIKHILSN